MKNPGLAAAGAVAATFVWSSAHAIVITPSFTFSGQTNVEGNINTFGPAFPPGGVFRSDDGSEGSQSFGTITGSGGNTPVFTYSNGATATGQTTANSTTRVSVNITNDLTIAQTITWNFTIFAGGAGIVTPDLSSSGCNRFQLDICDTFLAAPLSHGASANLDFGVTFEGASVFDGSILVDAATMTAQFNGISLTNFRVAPTNSQYYWWDETMGTIDLGAFAPGETKTLEFFTSVMVAATANDGCFFDNPSESVKCLAAATAGYGDPDSAGGVITRAFFYSSPIEETFDSEPVPIPGAIWLFLTGLGGLFGARKLKKSA